ncbi:MAG: hypothetical protein LBR62_03290 [Puniceicoccales bacterium]|jgi:signal transduction histidine kinase|nr:hypothetical protein [Puniceicoccales bacterium]
MIGRDRYWAKVLARAEALDSGEFGAILKCLAKERERLLSIFHLLREAVLIVDGAGVVEFYNDTAGYLLGLTEKDIYSLAIWKIIPDLGPFFSEKSPKSTVLSRQIELSYPSVRFLRLYLQPFVPAPAGEEEFILLMSDVTDEVASTEEQIADEKLNSVMGLACEVAHELGNPLNSIQIHLQLLDRRLKKHRAAKTLGTKTLSKSLAVCMEEIERLDGIVKNFLRALRFQPVACQNCDVLPLIKKGLALLKPQLDSLHIGVEIRIEKPVLPKIWADPDRVHQALFNVLKNAMEAIGVNGRIQISLDVTETDFVIAVVDSGKGFTPVEAAKVFQASFSDKPYGCGIGSMIVQRIMKEHGGRINVETREGTGSVVSLCFPLKEGGCPRLLPDSQKRIRKGRH